MSCDCTEFTCVMRGVFERTMMVPFQNEFYKQILASSTGSVVATVCLNPITVIKVKIQTSSVLASSNLRNVFRNILVQKGVRGFWSGTPMGILMSVPNTVVYLAAYEEIKVILSKRAFDKQSSMHHLVPGIAGGLARLFSVSVITPLELIRTVQTGGVNKSIASIGREIIQNRGISGLYRGWLPSVLRDCPFSAIYWYCFEVFRPRYTSLIDTCRSVADSTTSSTSTSTSTIVGSDSRTNSPPASPPSTNATNSSNSLSSGSSSNGFSVFATFLSGASSGMIAALATHPYDVIKTKQQMAVMVNTSTTSSSGSSNSGSGKVSIRILMAEGGVAALYRGLSMRLVSVIPASAIVVTIYEKIKSIKF